jgi:hypothetical protein
LAGTRRCEVGGGGGGRRFGGGGDKRFGAIATVDGRTIVATILVGRRKLVGQSDKGTIVCVWQICKRSYTGKPMRHVLVCRLSTNCSP